jgi:hypothetical protein
MESIPTTNYEKDNDKDNEKPKKNVNGIILILSCQKHKDTRLKEFSLPKTNYNNWEVIYVIGDLLMEKDYILDGNFLYVKCEDSYIHLLKKLVLSIKYLRELFIIKEGILRCGDDLIFNEQNLLKFLHKNTKKFDYYGQSYNGKDYRCSINTIKDLKNTKRDFFMIDYYKAHPKDFLNPHHNLKNVNISLYSLRPNLLSAVGVIYYISNKACEALIRHMENINYNIFHYDKFTKSYPYTIEDCAVSFIMYCNKIDFIHNSRFFDTPNVDTIATHTNKYK